MKISQPLISLFCAWGSAILLTAGTIFAGDLLDTEILALGGLQLLAIVAITTLKAILILHYYLDFRLAPKSWQRGSYVFVFVLMLAIAVFYMIPA